MPVVVHPLGQDTDEVAVAVARTAVLAAVEWAAVCAAGAAGFSAFAVVLAVAARE